MIYQTLNTSPMLPTIHLGGGHDHVYPLLVAVEKAYPEKKLNIINIDAHLDTRSDQLHHSGTPFRRFDQKTDKPFNLNQVAIQSESNTQENYEDLKNGTMTIYPVPEFDLNSNEQLFDVFSKSMKTSADYLNILSIDLDVCDSSDFRSCSAVNPCGLKNTQIDHLISLYQKSIKHHGIYGFYEYNPLYDDKSNSDGKKIAWKLNQIIKKAR